MQVVGQVGGIFSEQLQAVQVVQIAVTVIPSLVLKMGYETGVTEKDMSKLTHLSRLLDERLNRAPNRGAPYVGESAFAHKGGLHVSAVEKDPSTYEHVDPEKIGNSRHIVVSDQSGRANILARFREIGIEIQRPANANHSCTS